MKNGSSDRSPSGRKENITLLKQVGGNPALFLLQVVQSSVVDLVFTDVGDVHHTDVTRWILLRHRLTTEDFGNITDRIFTDTGILETQVILILLSEDTVNAPVAFFFKLGKHHKGVISYFK